MAASLQQKYAAKVSSGELSSDTGQQRVVDALHNLATEIARHQPKGQGVLSKIFGSRPTEAPKGLYIWGGVGRGKTMLMDLFFEALPREDKRRAHFLNFMRDVHARIHRIRQKQRDGKIWEDSDPIEIVADEISENSRIICFDEFQVSDISDAMILGRLFSALFERGCIVVTTSNIEPSQLYKDGLNRNAFLPFIDILKQHMTVIPLDDGTDYRLGRLSAEQTYLTPLNQSVRKKFQTLWKTVTEIEPGEAETETLTVNGRELTVPRAARGACMFSFSELCEKPLASSDYLAISEKYTTVFLHDVPVFTAEMRNEARRFISLIDVLYDERIRLVVSAAAAPGELHQLKDHKFEFERTVSRLNEMQSADYFEETGEPEIAGT